MGGTGGNRGVGVLGEVHLGTWKCGSCIETVHLERCCSVVPSRLLLPPPVVVMSLVDRVTKFVEETCIPAEEVREGDGQKAALAGGTSVWVLGVGGVFHVCLLVFAGV